MTNLVTLIQIACVAFLAWGGALSLKCMIWDVMGDSRALQRQHDSKGHHLVFG